MANDFNRGIRIYLDTSDYGKGLEEMAAKTKEYEKELENLTDQAEEMAKAGQKGSKEWEKLQKQIEKKTKQLKTATTAEGKYRQKLEETERVLKNLSGATYKELLAAQRQLREEMQRCTRDSEQYRAAHEQLIRVDKELAKAKRDLNSQLGSEGTLAGKAANWLNKYATMIASAVAAVTGVSMAFRKLAEDVAHMDDVYSDVMKTTGMTREEVEDLNESLKQMDTRTSREELNLLARDAGKLGLESKKDILDFVDAGNQIRIALGEDLGKDAITSIGKMTDVFAASSRELDGLDLKGRMLAVGSAVNELGASSTASEPYLVDFAGRLGGVAKQAGISMSAILGFASTLDQNMQQVEMSATALQNFILAMMTQPATFARIAGMEVKQFTDLLKTDANEAIKTVLRTMNEQGDFTQLAPLFKEMGTEGSRAVGVLSTLAGNLDKVDEAQRIASAAMLEGTSLTDEYSIKNSNLQAELEKARKSFTETALELGQSLNPALLASTNGVTYLIKGLVALPKWLKENAATLASLTIAITAYTVAVNASVVADKLKVLWNDKLVASFKKLWAVVTKNPWGALVAVLALVVGKIVDYYREVNAVTEAERALQNVREKTNAQYDEQAAKVDLLNQQLRNEKLSIDERRAALEKLRELVPGYHAELTDEGTLINDNKRAIDEYLVSLEKQIRLQSAREELEELYRQKRQQERVVNEKQEVQHESARRLNAAKASTYGSQSYGKLSTPGMQVFAQNAGYGQEESALRKANKDLEKAQNDLNGILDAIITIENEIRNTPLTISTEQFKEGDEQLIGGVLMVYKGGKWVKKTITSTPVTADQQQAIDQFLADLKVRTELAAQEYAKQLQQAGLYEREWTELSEAERNRRLQIDQAYFQSLYELQVQAENARFEKEKESMGLNAPRVQLSGQQLEALELLERQHSANLQRIEADRQKQSETTAKAVYKAQLDLERANADALEKSVEAREQAVTLKLKQLLADRLITQEEYEEETRELARETLEVKLLVAEQERAALLELDDTPERKAELDALEQRINQLKQQLADMGIADNREADKGAGATGKRRQSALEKYGLTTLADQQAQELEALRQAYDAKLLSEEEYQQARLQLQLKYGQQYGQQAQQIIQAGSQLVSSLEEAETAKVQAEYARREAALTEQYNQGVLSQEQYNAQKEQLDYEQRSAELEVQKKYADANFALQVAQITASTSLAAMNAYSAMASIPYVGPVLGVAAAAAAIAAGAVQIAAAKAERDRVKALTLENPSAGGGEAAQSAPTGRLVAVGQAAEGRWDVVGADDRRTYRNVPYRGVMRTGIVARPTLVGERGDELVVDHPTLQNLRMNAPGVLDTILHYRVAQRAAGAYGPLDTPYPTPNPLKGESPLNSPQGGALLSRLSDNLERNNALLSRLASDPLMAYVVLSELEAKQQLRDKSVKKGSIR